MGPETQRPGTLSYPLPSTLLPAFSASPAPPPSPPPPCLTLSTAHFPRARTNKKTNSAARSGGGSGGSSEGRRELAFISPASLIPTLIPAQHPVSRAVLKLTLLQAPSRQPFLRSASSGTSKEEPEVSLLQPASLAALQQSLGSQGAVGRGGCRGAVPGLTFRRKRGGWR